MLFPSIAEHEVAFVSGFRVSGMILVYSKGKKGDMGVFYGSLLNCTNLSSVFCHQVYIEFLSVGTGCILIFWG